MVVSFQGISLKVKNPSLVAETLMVDSNLQFFSFSSIGWCWGSDSTSKTLMTGSKSLCFSLSYICCGWASDPPLVSLPLPLLFSMSWGWGWDIMASDSFLIILSWYWTSNDASNTEA